MWDTGDPPCGPAGVLPLLGGPEHGGGHGGLRGDSGCAHWASREGAEGREAPCCCGFGLPGHPRRQNRHRQQWF